MRNALVFLLLSSVFVTAAEIRISVQFDPDKQEVYGSQWIKFNEPTKEAWFVLLANLGRERNPYVSPLVIDSNYVFGFDPSWTKIETVVWEPTSQPVDYALLPAPPTYQTYSLEDVLMRVKLPGEPGELRIDFRTRFPHVWVEPGRLGDIYTWRFGWHPLLLPSAPGDVLPFALPFHSYSVELVLPEGWRAFLPGNAKAEGTRFSTTFVEPVSSVALYFGPAERFHAFTLACSGWILEGVALPGDEPALRSLLTWIPEILAWYEERFGPYPHRRLLLVEHPTEQGVAMTAEGVVFLPRWFFQRQDLTASGVLTRYGLYILAHELAHLWWGIGVGVDFDAENWLSEGLSQYLSITWYEEKFGAEGGNLFAFDKKGLGEEIVDYALGFVNLREHLTELPYLQVAFYGFDEAVVKPTREVQYDHVSGDRLYNKGYLVLRALAYLLGEDTFHQALRRAASQFRGRTLSVTDFQHLLEAESQRDLSRFFEDWVTGQAWADYGVNGLRQWPAPPGYQVELSLTYRGTGVLPVPLELRGPEGKRKVLVWEPKGTPAEAMVVMSEFPIEQVILDPEHRVLDVDRLNNRWPRRYVVALKNDLPLDGYLVSLGSSGAFSLSYLDRFAFAVYPQELALEGFVNFGQVGYVSAWAQIQDTLVGAITVARTLWLTPRTGSAAKYWEEAGELSFTVGRLPDWVFEVGLAWQESVAHARATDASFLFVPNQGYGLSLSHTELFGLAPNLYPTLTFSLGFASPALSPRFWPTLTELRALSLREEGPPSARHKAAAVLGVWLPPYFPSYSLGQAALVSEARPRVFFAAAQIWNESEERQTFVEVGGELWLTVEALGGLWSASLVLGLSYPLLPEGPVLLYFGLAG
ncbi:MAG: M1 family aminopeptidase [Candidatus Bipolaricaulota bacterium]|nr:M1 family aminopeptidase [Candidatus Bipolaricaulota bacterium]MDW8126905.1 M1 family aminopeptidase [Candidatus Bipolaricaulota bacterium]